MSGNIITASTTEELKKIPGYPTENRFRKGMVAVIECEQKIPCNPCVKLCPRKAIAIEGSITNLPKLYGDKCIGCGMCVAGCPGQAIFMVDETFSESADLVGIPYEYLPAVSVGEMVAVADRNGQKIGIGKINKVVSNKKNDMTTVVYIAVDKGLGKEVRAIVSRDR